MAFVDAILSRNFGVIKDSDNDTTEKITRVLRDDDGFISGEGLNFLNIILRIAGLKENNAMDIFSVQDLMDSIKVVKGHDEQFDYNKGAIFVSWLGHANELTPVTIRDAIQKVEEFNNATQQAFSDTEDYNEQIELVNDILSRNADSIKEQDEYSAEKITKALQDNDGYISDESLKFLNTILKIANTDINDKNRCFSIQELIDLINVVKDQDGRFDLVKSPRYIMNFAREIHNNQTIRDAILIVKKLDSKT